MLDTSTGVPHAMASRAGSPKPSYRRKVHQRRGPGVEVWKIGIGYVAQENEAFQISAGSAVATAIDELSATPSDYEPLLVSNWQAEEHSRNE